MLCHWPPTQAGQSVKGQLGQISGFSIGTRHSTQTWYFLSSHFYSFRLPSPVSFLCWAQPLVAPPQAAALLSAHFTTIAILIFLDWHLDILGGHKISANPTVLPEWWYMIFMFTLTALCFGVICQVSVGQLITIDLFYFTNSFSSRNVDEGST